MNLPVPAVRILRCEHQDIPQNAIGVIVGLVGDGLAVAVPVGPNTITVYVERDAIEPIVDPPLNGTPQPLPGA